MNGVTIPDSLEEIKGAPGAREVASKLWGRPYPDIGDEDEESRELVCERAGCE